MSKFAPPQPEESVSVNVVPLVDIMFLLLLFLMIGGDMSHRESTEVMLPQADKAAESNPDVGDSRYCIINIHPKNDNMARDNPAYGLVENWQFAIQGLEYPDYWTLLDGDGPGGARPGIKVIAQTKLETDPIEGTKPPKYLSAVFVTLRADKDAPYAMIQLAMQACAEASLYKIEVGAAKPAE
jgi:biopolymer transport protein ExbD